MLIKREYVTEHDNSSLTCARVSGEGSLKGRSRKEYCVRSFPHSGQDEGSVFRLKILWSQNGQVGKQMMSCTRFSAAADLPAVLDLPVDADEAGEALLRAGDSISRGRIFNWSCAKLITL